MNHAQFFKLKLIILIILAVVLGLEAVGGGGVTEDQVAHPCVPRDFGKGSVVCVCNATYCDVTPQLRIPSGFNRKRGKGKSSPETPVQVFTSSKSGLRLHKSTSAFSPSKGTGSRKKKIYGKASPVERRSVHQGFLSQLLGFMRISPPPPPGRRRAGTEEDEEVDASFPTLRIRRSVQYQKILGIGGSFTDSAGGNIRKLSRPAQERLMKSYFGLEGSDYSLARVPIGGTDFSPRAYTYCDTSTPDVNLTHFAIQPEDMNLKIPFIRWAEALRGQKLKLVASPWSAPVWMKTNRRLNGAGVLRREFYQVWADYFAKFIEAYAKMGISIWGVTTGNEPLNGFVPAFPFNCMGWAPGDVSMWIGNHLGPTLQAKFPDQKIQLIMLDDNKVLLPLWARTVLHPNRSSSAYVDGVGTHWYLDFLVGNSALSQFHASHPNHFILQTEACLGFVPWEREKVLLGSWERGETYLGAIINDMRNWVGGWIDWNLALDMDGGPNWAGWRADAAILVDKDKDEFLKQPIYYGIAHVSKFVPPGSIRIGMEEDLGMVGGSESFVQTVAFLRPDNGTVIVILNKSPSLLRLSIQDDEKGNFPVEIPGRGMQTVVYW